MIRLLTNNAIADQLYQSVGFIKVDGEYKASHIMNIAQSNQNDEIT